MDAFGKILLLLLCIICNPPTFVNGQLHSKDPSKKTVTIALSERKPFVTFDQNGMPTGLDVSIINNFAQKFNLQISFLIVNVSLNFVFAREENFNIYKSELG